MCGEEPGKVIESRVSGATCRSVAHTYFSGYLAAPMPAAQSSSLPMHTHVLPQRHICVFLRLSDTEAGAALDTPVLDLSQIRHMEGRDVPVAVSRPQLHDHALASVMREVAQT